MLRLIRFILASFPVLALSSPLLAADTQVAVAANFTEPAKQIAADFAKATSHRAILSFGSSGAFYAQMTHGAPFEIFLSADADRPKKAEQDGIAMPGTRFTYAIGRLVLYSIDPALVDRRGAVLKGGNFARLSIADPIAAPYGLAAVQTMQKMGVYSAIAPKIVKGTSITQAYDFVATGAAPLGFIALSQVVTIPGGSRWLVPQSLHAPIEQQAILLKVGAGNPAAKAFLKYLRSPAAIRIIKRYGYETR
ncbi:molybdate ABC transporter substrate-binding protein [Sphingomonas crusticola]|uniref:molybdate ABC transporter substrate-binding protein n=1 Tax=Sphingomonas crusticola TaxID=1697973 RepID=UPI000E262A60|nr:molybdate ABC transporter substrate-binding protein [Sphingomonas crusticola]